MNKNIHLLPTNKPTGIFELKNGLHFSIIKKIRYGEFKGFHIYITSDEEIKRGDYFLSLNEDESYLEVTLNDEVDDFNEYADEDWVENCKKIILTTDQDLIKDGVQAIDDNFLQWFVKNPSCERIVFEKIQYNPVFDEDDLSYDGMTAYYNYKIIIPQEEPKQTDWKESTKLLMEAYGDDPKDFPYEEPKQKYALVDTYPDLDKLLKDKKQETLEEAMNENGYHDQSSDELWREGVQFGAKWQAERMYSEDEVLNILYQWSMYKIDIELERLADELPNILPYNEWFEQHKKK